MRGSCLFKAVTPSNSDSFRSLWGLCCIWCRADFIIKSSCGKPDCCWLENRSDKWLQGSLRSPSSFLTITNSTSLSLFLTPKCFSSGPSCCPSVGLWRQPAWFWFILRKWPLICTVIIRAKCQKCTNNDFTRGLYCNLLLQLTSTLQT